MADKKISQLTGAATPLSGTEVLPVVQSGATVNVAVSDLTAGRAVRTSNLTVTGGSLTGAQETGAVNVTQTWNTTGAPTALKVNITNTASGAAAALMDLQVGGTSLAKVDKSGNITHTGTITSNPSGTYRRILDNVGLTIVTPANAAGAVLLSQTGIQAWSITNQATSGNLNIGGNIVITPQNNVRIGAGALATNATNGFIYIPTCAGTPTGTPTAQTGFAPMVVDSTNNKLYVYVGGAWQVMN